MEAEKIIKTQSGYIHLVISITLLAIGIFLLTQKSFLGIIPIVINIIHLIGFMVINPNKAAVLVLFGDYKGTVIKNGFHWVNPFFTKRKISLRARNLDSKPIKVNDQLGNPIMIGVVLVWRVKNTFKAAFDVNDFEEFVNIQSETAIRKLASAYPYDTFDDDEAEMSLRSGLEDINNHYWISQLIVYLDGLAD